MVGGGVDEVPSGPEDVVLEPSEFNPLQPGPIGTLRVVDRKAGAEHGVSLISGEGDTDNAKFAISAGSVFPWLFDFRSQAPGTVYSIRVRVTDTTDGSRRLEKVLTIRLSEPHAPSAVWLDVESLSVLARPGDLVGRVRVEDVDLADRHTLALVEGEGGEDNGLFGLEGFELRVTGAVPVGVGLVRVRIRATDSTGRWREERLELRVEAPRLRITEVLSSELGGVADERGVAREWIEIRNELAQYVSLLGWFMTDDRAELGGWKIPAWTVAPGETLVVLADGLATPPANARYLHANFSLSADGEWVGLVQPDGRTVVSELEFPRQYPGVAYGIGEDGGLGYLPVPTPKAANGARATAGENPVVFGRAHGFFQEAFDLELTAALPGSVIRYTLDGTVPTASSGQEYGGPIRVTPNTTGVTRGVRVVRAVAVNAAAAYAPVGTQTYFFVNGVVGPSTDGVVSQSRLVTSITRHATYGPLLDDALLALPAVSVVMASGPSGTERAASVELVDPAEREAGFQIDCGIASTGTTSLGSPKLSMAARFRTKYGRAKLEYPVFARGSRFPVGAAEEFNELRLRSHSHDTFYWLGTRENPPVPYGSPSVTRSGDAQLARNPWIEEMQMAMGQPGKRGRQVHLYLNGAYHGIYHVHEHADEDFMASYYPGSRRDFHFTASAIGGSDHGGGDTWRQVWTRVKGSLGNYAEARRWIDVTNLCDYMVLSFYAGNDWDWSAQHNWSAAGPRAADQGGWKFFQQDSDISLQDVNADCTDQDVPDSIFTVLMRQPDFRVLFRDRVYRHCYGDGVLTPGVAGAWYDSWMEELRLPIVAETARWQPSSSVGALPWDRDQEWLNEWRYLRETFFPQRTTRLMQQIRRRSGWWAVEPPVASHGSGVVPAGEALRFEAAVGTVYYTTDRSDPRLPGGGVRPGALVGSLLVSQPTLVRARTYSGSDWSALVEVYARPSGTVAADGGNLVLSEIHYHPSGDSEAEFLEFLNPTSGWVDLSGVAVAKAVRFWFPWGTALEGGGRLVVTKDLAAYGARYGQAGTPYYRPGVRVLGPWSGSLSNGGETMEVLGADGGLLFACAYGTEGGWPKAADGRGSSLELRGSDSIPTTVAARSAWFSDPAHWRASGEMHGSPGTAGAEGGGGEVGYAAWVNSVFAPGTPGSQTAPEADPDGDGQSNLAEYVFGSRPLEREGPPLEMGRGTDGVAPWLSYRYRSAAIEQAVVVETSLDLAVWSAVGTEAVETARELLDEGVVRVTLRVGESNAGVVGGRYYRLRAVAR